MKYAILEYAEDMHAGRLSILGAVYDFRDDLKQGAGRLVIVNLNGETDPKKITAALELPELHTNQSQP